MLKHLKQYLDYRCARPVRPARTFEVNRIKLDDGSYHTTNRATMVDVMPDGTVIRTPVIFFSFGVAVHANDQWYFYDKKGNIIPNDYETID